MTTAMIEPTPGPYMLSPSALPLAGYDHLSARGVPRIVEVEMRWISMNEHDATNILFAFSEPLLKAGRDIVDAADKDFAPQDFARAMNKLMETVDELEGRLAAKRSRPIEPVAGPYSISPVRKNDTIILQAPGAPVLARVCGRHVPATVQVANAILFTKAPELLKAARLLVEGERTENDAFYDEGLDLMRSTTAVIDRALQVL